MTTTQLEELTARFDAPNVRAILLVGSYARAEAGPYSDIDLLRLVGGKSDGSGSHLWQGKLVNVSDAEPSKLEASFSEPEAAVDSVLGFRSAQVLRDKDGSADCLLAQARAFVWTPELQAKADRWASAQLVGWAEEVHKGLAGLEKGDTGKLLNARFGLSWGLARIMRVQRGLLAQGDNSFFADLEREFAGTRWLEKLHEVYGLTGLPLTEQVRSGLELYVLTVELLAGRLQEADYPIIEHTVHLIRSHE